MSDRDNAGMTLEPLLSVEEARSILGISEAGIYRLFRRGELPVVEVGIGRRLIEPQALREYIAARRRPRKDDEPVGPGSRVEASVDAGDGVGSL